MFYSNLESSQICRMPISMLISVFVLLGLVRNLGQCLGWVNIFIVFDTHFDTTENQEVFNNG